MEEGLNAGVAALYQQGLQQDPEPLRILVLIHKMGTKICTRKNSRKDSTLPTAWHRLNPTVAPISIDGDILTTVWGSWIHGWPPPVPSFLYIIVTHPSRVNSAPLESGPAL